MYRKMLIKFCWYFVLALLLFYPQVLLATEEYAEKTGKECASCHVDPSGGYELTEEGKQTLELASKVNIELLNMLNQLLNP